MNVDAYRPRIVQDLNQDEPGQLGKLTKAMADAGVNIQMLYSVHDHQIVIALSDATAPHRRLSPTHVHTSVHSLHFF
ncbi:MAG: hypothetical protein ACI9BK_001465 [Acidimicrobiales bacterium]|jgi:hypothetical protein